MDKDITYNGWTNYETWCVNLWMNEEESYYSELSQNVWDEAKADDIFTKEQRAVYNLADMLSGKFKQENPLAQNSIYTDLLNAAISSVNWDEIAKNMINNVKEGMVVNV